MYAHTAILIYDLLRIQVVEKLPRPTAITSHAYNIVVIYGGQHV